MDDMEQLLWISASECMSKQDLVTEMYWHRRLIEYINMQSSVSILNVNYFCCASNSNISLTNIHSLCYKLNSF